MSKKGRKSRSVFNRITLTVVLGLFILLVATMLLTAAAVSVIVSFGAVENLWLYGIIIFAISVAIGTGLSFAYSAVMVKITRPYVEGLQKIADCDFSVRIQDSPLLAGLGIAQNFNDMAKKSKSGLQDYLEYMTERATVEELKKQNSYFINTLYGGTGNGSA